MCHLLIYLGGKNPPVCVVGNFEGHVSPPTGGAIESVATALTDRLGREDFRLIEWYPRSSQTEHNFTEVTLKHVLPTAIPSGELVIPDSARPGRSRHTTVVRFTEPRWGHRREDDLAALLGEPAIRQLRAYAGIPGDYTPQRLFGSTGRSRADAIHDHNKQAAENLEAQLANGAGPAGTQRRRSRMHRETRDGHGREDPHPCHCVIARNHRLVNRLRAFGDHPDEPSIPSAPVGPGGEGDRLRGEAGVGATSPSATKCLAQRVLDQPGEDA